MKGIDSEIRQGLADPSVALHLQTLGFREDRPSDTGSGVLRRHRPQVPGPNSNESSLPSPPLFGAAADTLARPRSTVHRRRPTQPITAADIKGGRVRAPSTSRDILPAEPARISVYVNGELMNVRWDPRDSRDRSEFTGFGMRTMREDFVPGVQRRFSKRTVCTPSGRSCGHPDRGISFRTAPRKCTPGT